MDRDEIKGKAKDIMGRVERQAGEWTGDKDAQGEGIKDQAKGKIQNAWGKVKDAGSDVKDNTDREKLDRLIAISSATPSTTATSTKTAT